MLEFPKVPKRMSVKQCADIAVQSDPEAIIIMVKGKDGDLDFYTSGEILAPEAIFMAEVFKKYVLDCE